jgi:hypothetical protein
MSHAGKVKCKGCNKHCWVYWTESKVVDGKYISTKCEVIGEVNE